MDFEATNDATDDEDDELTPARLSNHVYTVMVTAVDPSGAVGRATVTVTLDDVNEAPEFAKSAPIGVDRLWEN